MGRVGSFSRRFSSSLARRWEVTVFPMPYSPSRAKNCSPFGSDTHSSRDSRIGRPDSSIGADSHLSKLTVIARGSSMKPPPAKMGSKSPIVATLGLKFTGRTTFAACPAAIFWSRSLCGLFFSSAQSQIPLTSNQRVFSRHARSMPEPSISPPTILACLALSSSRYSLLSTRASPLSTRP